MRALLLLLALIMPTFAVGDIYKYVAPDGTVAYTDRPREGAVEVEVKALQTYTPSAPVETETFQERKQQEIPSVSYQISIVKPQDKATIRDNTGKVAVIVQVEPPLEKGAGYTIQLLLDGQEIEELSSGGEYTLTGVVRGTHTLQAKLLAPSGKVVAQAGSVTFYMKHMSRLFHPPTNGKGQSDGVQRAPRAPQMPEPSDVGGVTFP